MDYRLVCLLLAAYLVGNISPGWWLVYLRGCGDVRAQGSGGTGATNTARALGKNWFYAVLALDMLKAAVAVSAPFLVYGGSAPMEYHVACGLAVISGHIWPVLLGFRGGKGVGPFLGVWVGMGLVYWPVPLTLLGPIIGGVLFLPLKKGTFMCALCALMAQPFCFWLLTENRIATLLAVVVAAFIQFAHRSNFKTAFAKQDATHERR